MHENSESSSLVPIKYTVYCETAMPVTVGLRLVIRSNPASFQHVSILICDALFLYIYIITT